MSDVFLPSPEDLSHRSSAPTEAEGVIIDFSDSGLKHHAFAVVELKNGQTMVVPVEKLKSVPDGSLETAGDGATDLSR